MVGRWNDLPIDTDDFMDTELVEAGSMAAMTTVKNVVAVAIILATLSFAEDLFAITTILLLRDDVHVNFDDGACC
jgi:recombinational DNA repair ATPase RecF